jgi:carbon monoxide dehydrogenase subunit G
MADGFEVTVDVDAPPDAVWAVLGDPTAVPRWYPKYVAAEVDGERRVIRSADGREVVERLLERDEAARSYSYTVLSGAPVVDHRASFTVEARGEGSRVVWRTEGRSTVEGASLEERLRGSQTDALAGLKAMIEADAAR